MLSEFLNKVYFGNPLSEYLVCAAIFVLSLIVLEIVRKILIVKLKAAASRTKTMIDDLVIDILQKNIVPVLYYGALYLSLQRLKLPESGDKALSLIGVVIFTIMAIRFFVTFINYALLTFWLKGETNEAREHSFKGVISVVKVLLWGGGIVFLLDNLGFKVSTVIAGLGIGGVAVALAAQAILGDLFSFFSIISDRPFEVGDFIIIGEFMGTVEYIGIKTTRLRSLGGEQLIFANSDLTNSRVRNYKRMNERRVVFKFGVTYQTALDRLKEIPGLIKDTIARVKDTRFDRAHFAAFGDFSLNIEVVYYVLSPDYNKYMDVQQEINFALMQEFGKRNIEFAYPTQTVYVNKG